MELNLSVYCLHQQMNTSCSWDRSSLSLRSMFKSLCASFRGKKQLRWTSSRRGWWGGEGLVMLSRIMFITVSDWQISAIKIILNPSTTFKTFSTKRTMSSKWTTRQNVNPQRSQNCTPQTIDGQVRLQRQEVQEYRESGPQRGAALKQKTCFDACVARTRRGKEADVVRGPWFQWCEGYTPSTRSRPWWSWADPRWPPHPPNAAIGGDRTAMNRWKTGTWSTECGEHTDLVEREKWIQE